MTAVTQDEVDRIYTLRQTGALASEIAKRIGRSTAVVQRVLKRLGVSTPPAGAWTTEETQALLRIVSRNGNLAQASAALPHKSKGSILGRARRMGLQWRKTPEPPKQKPNFSFNGGSADKAKKPEPIPSVTIPDKRKEDTKAIWQLEACDCKWLYEYDGERRYCAEVVSYKSYCERHAARVYKERDDGSRRPKAAYGNAGWTLHRPQTPRIQQALFPRVSENQRGRIQSAAPRADSRLEKKQCS